MKVRNMLGSEAEVGHKEDIEAFACEIAWKTGIPVKAVKAENDENNIYV